MDNGDQPATKKELGALSSDLAVLRSDVAVLSSDVAELRSELRGEIGSLEENLREAIHDAETRVLTAFYSFAGTNQRHLNDLDASDVLVRARIGSMEARLLEVEKRLNIPSAPPS